MDVSSLKIVFTTPFFSSCLPTNASCWQARSMASLLLQDSSPRGRTIRAFRSMLFPLRPFYVATIRMACSVDLWLCLSPSARVRNWELTAKYCCRFWNRTRLSCKVSCHSLGKNNARSVVNALHAYCLCVHANDLCAE